MQAPVAIRPLLRVSASIPDIVAAGEREGTIPVSLMLENTSHVAAQLPFLCVTDLGFNIQPVIYGQMEKISADGRRLVRFVLPPGAVLDSGAKSSICTLTMSWRGGDPPFVAYDLGAGLGLDALRDLRMFCVTGAANFPSERTHIVLTAADAGAAVAAASGMPSDYAWQRQAAEA